MRFLAVSLLALLPSAAAVAADMRVPPAISVITPNGVISPVGANCPRPTNYYAYKDGQPLKPQKLAELPPGNMYSAVFHRDVNGCEVPIVVKYRVDRR